MSSIIFSALVWVGSVGAALMGMMFRAKLPRHHLTDDSRDVVKLAIALVATISALVLSLLISSASTSYDRQVTQLKALSADIILLDRILDLYGTDAHPARDQLRAVVQQLHDRTWAPGGVRIEDLGSLETWTSIRANIEMVQSLTPKTDLQRVMQAQAMQQTESIGKARLLLFESLGGSITAPFLTILVFWIFCLFMGFGLLCRFNATVTVALALGGLSVAGALFLILEMNSPYTGVMKISDEPLLKAIAVIGR